jgi:hypothetical protein
MELVAATDGTMDIDWIERTEDSGMGLSGYNNRISICSKIVKRCNMCDPGLAASSRALELAFATRSRRWVVFETWRWREMRLVPGLRGHIQGWRLFPFLIIF